MNGESKDLITECGEPGAKSKGAVESNPHFSAVATTDINYDFGDEL
jgi:hypothetical protein